MDAIVGQEPNVYFEQKTVNVSAQSQGHVACCKKHLRNNFKEEEHILEMRSLVDEIIVILISGETTMPH